MKLLFEKQPYPYSIIKDLDMSRYFVPCEGNQAVQTPYVGYFYSPNIKDSVFILPKVFMMSGVHPDEQGQGEQYLAFGKWHPSEIVNIDSDNNPLKLEGLDNMVFSLSTWLYQAILLYKRRNPDSQIIENAEIQNVISNKGEYTETFLDVILSLIRFHKDHRQIFTYISIVNSSGNNKIHWSKTISKVLPIIQGNEPYYMEFRNKNKTINYDEEIIVLFYSVLAYLREKNCCPIRSNLNYALIKPRKVESMIESGQGTRLLRSIRRKYFTDEFVALWKLLYVFFEKAEAVANHNYQEEALLIRNFNIVFEDMIDFLISDKTQAVSGLKVNKDDKRIDHIYKDRSLVDPNSDLIYFIADSKYYKENTDIQGTSLFKQYTYARNIIQYNIDIFNKIDRGQSISNLEKQTIEGTRYRDDLTEGYNITPNFFIRGSIIPEDIFRGNANYSDPRLAPETENGKDIIRTSDHFFNRLFDRDTLVLESYNINFLFVLAAYALQKDNRTFCDKVKHDFRTHLTKTFNERYKFYKVTPFGNVDDFVHKHFKMLIGKIYRSSASEDTLWLALDRSDATNNSIIEAVEKDANCVATTI